MLILLPLLTLAVLIVLVRLHFAGSLDLRLAILGGAAAWGGLLALLTEALSLLHAFHRAGLAAGWTVLLLAAAAWAVLLWRKRRPPRLQLPQLHAGWLGRFQLASMAGIALLTGAIGVIAAPNNWDSMVYHLSRAVHWLQNGSVAFYPTGILRQLYLPPWSEYLLAHLLALGEGDRFVQLAQWLAMLGSAIGVSLLARQLGARPAGQVTAAFAVVMLPMGILQAATTQNDYVVTFWLVCLAAFLLHDLETPTTVGRVGAGLALGLAVLTKSTAYIYALPFMLYYGVQLLRRRRAEAWRPVLLITALVLALNLPHYARNARLFGHPLGPQAEVARYHNQPISLVGTVSNVVRNVGLYLGSVEPANRALNAGITAVHGWMGLDVNDPRFTWSDHRFTITPPQAHEDTTASSLHLLLLVASFVYLAARRRQLPSTRFLLLGGLLLAGFLIFSAYLRWQVWHPRLHLPLLVLGCAWVGLLDQVAPRWTLWLASLGLAALALPVFYFNASKPLAADYTIFNLPRREVMLMRKNLVVPYIEGVNFLEEQGCYQAGLYIRNEEWEYPFWSLYAEHGQPYRLEHVNVANTSARLPQAAFEPCAVIATQPDGERFIREDGSAYRQAWQMDPITIYLREP